MDDATAILLPPIIAVVSSLAAGTLDALAQTIATCHPDDWPATRVQIMQVVPQPQLRHLVGALVATWHQQAPQVPPAQVAVMLRTAAATAQHMRQEQRAALGQAERRVGEAGGGVGLSVKRPLC